MLENWAVNERRLTPKYMASAAANLLTAVSIVYFEELALTGDFKRDKLREFRHWVFESCVKFDGSGNCLLGLNEKLPDERPLNDSGAIFPLTAMAYDWLKTILPGLTATFTTWLGRHDGTTTFSTVLVVSGKS